VSISTGALKLCGPAGGVMHTRNGPLPKQSVFGEPSSPISLHTPVSGA
jgi:hypothetical protein